MYITKRLSIGFSTAIFLVILIGALSFATFQRQYKEAELVKQTYQIINQLGDVQKNLIDMETGQRGFRGTNEKRFLEPYFSGLQRIHPAIEHLQTLLESGAQQSRFNVVTAEIEDLLDYWNNLGEDSSNTTKPNNIGIMSFEKQKMDRIRKGISEMLYAANQSLLIRQKEDDNAVTLAKAGLVTGIFLILCIVIMLIFQILKELKNRKKAEEAVKENLKELTIVNQENAERNNVLTVVSKVNDVLQGHLSLTALTQVVLKTVIKCLNLKAGAFYVYNEEQKKVVLTASYSLAKDSKKEYELHEGFVGQAAVEKEPLIISDIPPKYATIQSATLRVEPVHAIYSSLFYNNELQGIIELLSFKPIEEKNIKLLKIVNNNIAAALYSALSRDKVLQLFSQIQQQKDVLQNQQEELRQTNEELTVQAEVLQASEEELRVQEEELRQINAELTEKNQSVENAGKELALKAKELELSSRYKSEFLSNMSHELRTPLNSVLILAKLLADNRENNLTEKQVSHAKIIHRAGSDLLSLINDILDLSKIEAGKVDLHVEEVSIESIVNDIEQLFTVVAEEKGIQYSIDLQPEVSKIIKTDKQKVEQVLKNLLSNAFKFTPKNGKVFLQFKAVREDGIDYVAISVIDTGIGISAAQQQNIFDAFQQADGSTNRKFGGTGLGLSITKELMRILKGKVYVESVENKGSTFTVLVPVETDVAKSSVTKQEEAGKAGLQNTEMLEQTRIADDRNFINENDKVMLIIEDDIAFASIIKDFAIENNYKSIVALQGDEGLFCARKYKPSAIILDMNLPVIDGWSLLKIFKDDPQLKDIPVHIISALEEAKAASSGAFAVLKKPVEKDDIEKAFTAIGEHLKSAVKKVMIFSENNLKDEIYSHFSRHRNYEVSWNFTGSLNEALANMQKEKYDCFIADIGSDITKGIAQLKDMELHLLPDPVPTIIYLDKDIDATAEVELKKIADVIVRKSSLSTNRLLDELELFLHKVNESETRPEAIYNKSFNGESTLHNKKVLLVDDDMRNIFALSAVFEQEKMDIITANDGKEAVDALEKNQNIDIVLMDIMMPEMDGYEAMGYIRKTLKLTQLPIIALTAKAMTSDKDKCIEAGASDYISKPVDTHKLVSLMRVWLS